MKKILPLALLSLIIAFPVLASPNEKTAAYNEVKDYLAAHKPFKYILSAEGEYIAVFNDHIRPWIEKKLDGELVSEIIRDLEPALRIELNDKGFVSAAQRKTKGKDATNYDAIWVRDNVWIYYSLLADPGRRADANRLLISLWDYYATPAQVQRFRNIIANPELSTDQMAMPHVRFDSNSLGLGDVMIDGKPQVWNHRQIDAHGIFFTALGEAFRDGILKVSDITEERARPLILYPLFLATIRYYDYEDAGAWEELPRKNTSSIGLATRSLQVWRGLLYDSSRSKDIHDRLNVFLAKEDSEVIASWSDNSLKELSDAGLNQVKYQLALGGESPDYNPIDIHFRLADSAMLVLIEPSTLEGLSQAQLRKTLDIVEQLKRPAGVLRYNNDSYQGGNFWIETPDSSSLTGDTSSKGAFLDRLKKLIPNTEAEWFFDSLIALARLRLAEKTTDTKMRSIDIDLAAIHIKRALGQITGGGITADGEPVEEWLAPESINTVVIEGKRYYLPSPIAPLNWAKAALSMALRNYRDVASNF